MFSWSKKGGSSSSSTSTSYPANRSSASPPVAQNVQGSIRPPSSSSHNQAPLTREQHLQSYLTDNTLKPSTRKVSKDDSTYDTVFQTTSGDALILRVYFPPASSSSVYNSSGLSVQQRCPVMTLVGVSARHAWIDSRMKVKADGFPVFTSDDVWNSSGMTLGEAVNAVVREFQLRPPQILKITDDGLQKIQQSLTKSSTSTATTSSSTSSSRHADTSSPPDYESLVGNRSTTTTTNNHATTPLPDVPLPDIPHFFTELDSMDREDLESLLTDELEFLALRNSLPVYQEMDQQATTILEENVQVAHQHQEKQPQLEQLHKQVQQLQHTLETKIQTFQTLEQEQIQKCAPPNIHDVMKQLQKGRKASLEETEQMASEWVDEGGDIDTFMKEFLAKRTIHHSRAAKIERLQQQRLP